MGSKHKSIMPLMGSNHKCITLRVPRGQLASETGSILEGHVCAECACQHQHVAPFCVLSMQVLVLLPVCSLHICSCGRRHACQSVMHCLGAFGWRLTSDEVTALDSESSKLPSALGAPFENW